MTMRSFTMQHGTLIMGCWWHDSPILWDSELEKGDLILYNPILEIDMHIYIYYNRKWMAGIVPFVAWRTQVVSCQTWLFFMRSPIVWYSLVISQFKETAKCLISVTNWLQEVTCMTGKRRATIILTSYSCGPLPAIIISAKSPHLWNV